MSEKITLYTAIYAAVKELEAGTVALLPSLDSLSGKYTPKQEQNTQIEKEIEKTERKEKRNLYINRIYRMVSVFAVVFFMAFSPFLTVSAVQQAVSETAIGWYDKYISVESKSDYTSEKIKDFDMGYMAEGYSLYDEYYFGESVIKDFKNEELFISVELGIDDGSTLKGMDNERSNFYQLNIDGNTGLWMCSDDGYNNLLITVHNIQYNIGGYINIDEIIKIFKNIKIIL